MNSGGLDQLPQCFPNLNWENSFDPSSQFGSAPPGCFVPASSAAPGEGFRFGKHGRGLQSVAEGISPQLDQHVGGPMNALSKIDLAKLGQAVGGVSSSGHLTPVHLDRFPTEPSFAERAASFIGINDGNFPWLTSQVELPGKEKPSMVATGQSPMATGLKIGHLESNRQIPVLDELQMEMSNSELGKAKEEISAFVSPSGEGSNAKKRKAHLRSKEKDASNPSKVAEEDCNAKRQRYMENNNAIVNNNSTKPKLEQNDGANTNGEQKQGKACNVKSSEPPKDYVHVRARRGQATDSHSLAERVRREKINQRMKLLQDLVPGCCKVIGKAVMLDEIINYVQSLQRQVEFLSMKLATVNPRLDFSTLMNLLPKDMLQTCGAVPNSIHQFETGIASTYSNHARPRNPLNCIAISEMNPYYYMNLLDPTFHHNLNGFGDASSQSGVFWEDDLQSVVQMSMGHDQEFLSSSQNLNGTSPTAQMKAEL